MINPDSKHRLAELVSEALVLADSLGLGDVAINLDQALNKLDHTHTVLRDSADRLWALPA